jgi:maleylacetate reductase
MPTYHFSRLERVVWNEAAVPAVAREATTAGARRVFLISSHTLATTTDAISGIAAALGDRFAGLFDAVPAHAPEPAILRAAAAARAAQADLLVTVGGGSVIDAGKLVQLVLAHDANPDSLEALATAPPARLALRQVAVPTTLSAAEFGSGAGATDPVRRMKRVFRHPDMIPVAIILDPALTVHTPLWLWLSTGIRAVDHAAETLCSVKANPYTDAAATRALALLAAGLRRSHADPADLAARNDCQIAAWLSMAAVPAGIPLGASHAIGHVLGGAFGVPHGYTSCVMLPAVLRHNQAACPEAERAVSAALGRPDLPAADAVAGLVADLGLPGRLAEVGITEADFPTIAAQTLLERWATTNPVPLRSESDVLAVLRRAA